MIKIDKHHKLSKSKLHIKRYGELIHNYKNIQLINHENHLSGKYIKFNEREFCKKFELLKCKFCEKYISNGCVWKYKDKNNNFINAEFCRYFKFDKNKYNKNI